MEPAAFDRLARANRTFVVEHRSKGPVGFAIAGPVGAFLHLKELSVDPAHGRRGLGAALLAAAIAESRALRFAGVSLSTFRDVPFNAPFYARHGFVELTVEQAPDALKQRFHAEIPLGIDAETRVLMLRRNRQTPASKPKSS
ncbi:GNAT family N-acetyltransferase [Nitratireductor sp. ZSWI3]|nr:GNAT family N-acetyltransferase [Nitratireductor sp. ZSWI3]